MKALEIDNLIKDYGNFKALKGISLFFGINIWFMIY